MEGVTGISKNRKRLKKKKLNNKILGRIFWHSTECSMRPPFHGNSGLKVSAGMKKAGSVRNALNLNRTGVEVH